jgi:tRNA A-37 threonylcarbamoyl transferase component Bud32
MAFVDVEPRYGALLAAEGLVAPADFFELQGVFVGGHADRSIARVTLGAGANCLTAYLKREQRVRWRHRLGSAWAGLGFVSRCYREALLLRQLKQADIGCPEVIAAGEDDRGRAFLLVRELTHATELRPYLRDACSGSDDRRAVAVYLGRALAALHAAGFCHGDLYSKHILVRKDPAGGSIRFAFLDWQRSQRRRQLSWSRCCRDLAALDATLADDLAAPRQRLACLAAYCRHQEEATAGKTTIQASRRVYPGGAVHGGDKLRCSQIAPVIHQQASRLLRQRRIAEMRQPALAAEQQNLVRAEGEAVSLTRQFREELRAEMPAWLRLSAPGRKTGLCVTRVVLPVAPSRQATLVRHHASRPLSWLWSWLRGKTLLSSEVEQAGTLFRLERYGIRTPRLLAFGQYAVRPWRVDSMLLTERAAEALPLAEWFHFSPPDSAQRRLLTREAADVLRRLHAAACYLPADDERVAEAFQVQPQAGGPGQIVLADVAALERRHHPCARLALQNLVTMYATFRSDCGRTDALRFLLAYLDVPRLNAEARHLAGRVLRRATRARARV